ncbi:MAG: hypothetical protein ABW123_28110 [Cystobacter sp.]
MKTLVLCGMILTALASGCGPVDTAPSDPSQVQTQAQEAVEDNGLSFNGLAFNGLSLNGLNYNGLSLNGLKDNSFNDFRFMVWFIRNTAESDLLMKYLVRCAVPQGETRRYRKGLAVYEWQGGLGLAPGWSGGAPVTLEEQQVVSACLAALTNKYGRSVLLSLRGTTARGVTIPITSAEQADYPVREACFFGNLFTGQGIFVGNDRPLLPEGQSSLRACALMGTKECAPMVHVGSCQQSCAQDPSGSHFTRCTRGNVTYHAISTRLRTEDIYTCGDGRCQFPESYDSGPGLRQCRQDCRP